MLEWTEFDCLCGPKVIFNPFHSVHSVNFVILLILSILQILMILMILIILIEDEFVLETSRTKID